MIIRDKDSNGNWQEKTYHFWTNQRGDVLSILDSSGTVVGSYTYDAFGNVLSETGTIAQDNPIRYAGYYYDTETKHYYLQARYYNPANGNFQALDPQSGDTDDPSSQNGYAYSSNNPVKFYDPSGNQDMYVEAGGGGGAGVGGYGGAYVGGGAALVAGNIAAIGYIASKKASKPVHLPSYKTVKIDMEHILSGHSSNGKRGGPNKDRFPWWMSAPAIEKAVREAYKHSSLLQRQGERVFLKGPWGKSYIEMWVNTSTKVIESAWPK